MALTKWNPLFADLVATKERFNRLLGRDEFWDTQEVTTGGAWAPAVDIIENENALTIKLNYPALNPRMFL